MLLAQVPKSAFQNLSQVSGQVPSQVPRYFQNAFQMPTKYIEMI